VRRSSTSPPARGSRPHRQPETRQGNRRRADLALGEPFARQTWLRHYPNAGLTALPNIGHYPMFETPVVLVTTIEQYLRQK
jgi:pimeloyl-ACP methyl ester carboxylesterase